MVITIDGLRWQEFFGGAERDDFKRDKNGSAGEPERRLWRETPDARRSTLLPLVWNTIAAAVRRNVNVTTSQIAATIASLVGEDFRSAVPRVAPPLPLTR